MKRFFLLTTSLLFICFAAMAQKNDPEAKKILDAVSAKFKSFKSVISNVNYKVENAAGKVMSNKNGKFTLKGTKYYINFAGQEVLCNGATIWSIDKGAKEVSISNLDQSGSTLTPQKLFTSFYDNDFLYILNGDKKIGNTVVHEVELTPRDKSRPFHKVYLFIDKKTNVPVSTKVFETSGNRYTYTFSGLTTNGNVADALFVFDKKKYPGLEVVDLR